MAQALFSSKPQNFKGNTTLSSEFLVIRFNHIFMCFHLTKEFYGEQVYNLDLNIKLIDEF